MFAVPGEITTSLSAGSNALLRLGAVPLTGAEDVLESFGIAGTARAEPELAPEAAAVLAAVRDAAGGADELARATGLTAGGLAIVLTELELAGLVAEADGIYRAAT